MPLPARGRGRRDSRMPMSGSPRTTRALRGFDETALGEVRHAERGSAYSGGQDAQNVRCDAGSASSTASLNSRGEVNSPVYDRQSTHLRAFQHVPQCRSAMERGTEPWPRPYSSVITPRRGGADLSRGTRPAVIGAGQSTRSYHPAAFVANNENDTMMNTRRAGPNPTTFVRVVALADTKWALGRAPVVRQ